MVTSDQLRLVDEFLKESPPDDPWGCVPYFIGPETWAAFIALRAEVGRYRFAEHLEKASETVSTWPAWKQAVLGSSAIVADPHE